MYCLQVGQPEGLGSLSQEACEDLDSDATHQEGWLSVLRLKEEISSSESRGLNQNVPLSHSVHKASDPLIIQSAETP